MIKPKGIVFLDFDGVLHPAEPRTEGLFNGLERFRSFMSGYPDVGIVVHSSWRMAYETKEITNFLGDITNFLGVTPTFEPSRWESIETWQRVHGPLPYVILDDMHTSFPTEAKAHLICPEHFHGMQDHDYVELERRLKEICQ